MSKRTNSTQESRSSNGVRMQQTPEGIEVQEKRPSTTSNLTIAHLEIDERNAIVSGYLFYHFVILSDAVHDLCQTWNILDEQCVNAIVNETVSVVNESVSVVNETESVNTTGEVVLVDVIEFPRAFVWLVWGFSLAAVILSLFFIVAMLVEWCLYKGYCNRVRRELDIEQRSRFLVAWWLVSLTTSLPVELARQITTIVLSSLTDNSSCACFTLTIGSSFDAAVFAATFWFEVEGFKLLDKEFEPCKAAGMVLDRLFPCRGERNSASVREGQVSTALEVEVEVVVEKEKEKEEKEEKEEEEEEAGEAESLDGQEDKEMHSAGGKMSMQEERATKRQERGKDKSEEGTPTKLEEGSSSSTEKDEQEGQAEERATVREETRKGKSEEDIVILTKLEEGTNDEKEVRD